MLVNTIAITITGNTHQFIHSVLVFIDTIDRTDKVSALTSLHSTRERKIEKQITR